MATGPLPVFDIQNSSSHKSPATRGTQQFFDYAAQCDFNLPSYWIQRPWDNGQTGHLVKADPSVFSAIEDTIVQTWKPGLVGMGSDGRGLSPCDIEVVSVDRFEAPGLFRNYLQERRKLFAQCMIRGRPCPGIRGLYGSRGTVKSTAILPLVMKRELYWEVNEHYLFHGTKTEKVPSILSGGLDPAFSSPNAMFGQAVYTSESFTKADQYSDSKYVRSEPGTDLYMILARVLLGNVYVCANEYERQYLRGPPCIICRAYTCFCWFHPRYDSIMRDGNWLFRVFAVHYRNRCYPEYVIKYRRKKKRVLVEIAEEMEVEEGGGERGIDKKAEQNKAGTES